MQQAMTGDGGAAGTMLPQGIIGAEDTGSFGGMQARSAEELNRPKIVCENLDFYCGENKGLKNINITFPDKQVTGMIGPSGCGKSTLLGVLNRMYSLYPGQRPMGRVMMDGMNLIDNKVDLNALPAKIGIMFQKATPFPMTIYENIAFGVRLHEKLSKKEMDERVESSLSRAALWNEVKDRLDSNAMGLSGGQQQRLCIARTIAVRPEVILFDEPTSALDPIGTAKIAERIDELKARLHHRHRHPQLAAGGALCGPGRVRLPR